MKAYVLLVVTYGDFDVSMYEPIGVTTNKAVAVAWKEKGRQYAYKAVPMEPNIEKLNFPDEGLE